MTTLPRFLPLPEGSFFLFGPRGTGKTTWLRTTLPDAMFVDLLDPAEYRRLSARPEVLAERVRFAPPGSDVVIDEVQRVPELLNVVHSLIESGGGWRFVLTGSSARALRRGGVNLLAGRAIRREMHPFMAGELAATGADFDLDAALSLGTIPAVLAADDPREALDAYAALYVEQEVRAEGLARDVGSFSRFLEAVAFSHAAPLNIAEVARECETSRSTVAGYVELLEDLLLSFRMPVFTRRAKRRTVAHPRFFYFDCGVFRSLCRTGPIDRPAEIAGPALEGLVAQHLRAWIAYSDSRARLHYWRTRGGSEVDFVLYGGDDFCAVDVMHADRIRPADLRGLAAFGRDYPEADRFLLHRGRNRLVRSGVHCLPVEDFLLGLHPETSLMDAFQSFAGRRR